MSAAIQIMVAQKDKPESERLDSTKVVDIFNEDFRSTFKYLTVRQYVNQVHIGCSRLKIGPRGTVVDNDTYPFLLEAYITHFQLLQANGRKEPNLKDMITQTNVAVNIKDRKKAVNFVQNRLRSDAAGIFKVIEQYDQEAC